MGQEPRRAVASHVARAPRGRVRLFPRAPPFFFLRFSAFSNVFPPHCTRALVSLWCAVAFLGCVLHSFRYARSPGHVVIEAVCIIFIIYLIMRKPYNPKKTEKLSKQVWPSFCTPGPFLHLYLDSVIFVSPS
jgi:hypothetical protein